MALELGIELRMGIKKKKDLMEHLKDMVSLLFNYFSLFFH